MLASNKIVGFIATKDYRQARNFYENILGVEFVNQDPFALEFRAGGNMIRISKVDDFTPMPFTALGWQVDNMQTIVQELTERGVSFERYSFLKQDDLGIWEAPEGAKVARFKDPDGNLLLDLSLQKFLREITPFPPADAESLPAASGHKRSSAHHQSRAAIQK